MATGGERRGDEVLALVAARAAGPLRPLRGDGADEVALPDREVLPAAYATEGAGDALPVSGGGYSSSGPYEAAGAVDVVAP